MKAAVNYFSSPDVDLDNFHPQDAEDFSFLLQAAVGPVGVPEAGEAIQFIVCTLRSLERRLTSEAVVFGRPLVIVESPDIEQITDKVRTAIEAVEAPTWKELTCKLSRLGVYEFEDF